MKLLIIMCIGIALALYGMYVRSRANTNPNYMSPINTATHWMLDHVGSKILHPFRGGSCASRGIRHSFISEFLQMVVNSSGLVNGLINVTQIIVLKVNSSSVKSADAIIAMSSIGWVVSMICLVGAFSSCKLMCISCLGIQHVAIIYFAIKRRKMILSSQCPTASGIKTCNAKPSTIGTSANRSAGAVGNNSNRSNDTIMRRRSGRN